MVTKNIKANNFSARYTTNFTASQDGSLTFELTADDGYRFLVDGKEVLNAWTPTNTNTDIPRAVDGDPNNNSRSSDRFLESGSYLRLKLMSVGYNFGDISNKTGNTVKRLRVYLTAQNLLTFTSYSGYDPEIGSRFNAALTGGVDYGQFPQARTFIFGIQAGF